MRTTSVIAALALSACASLPESALTRESVDIDDASVLSAPYFCYFPVDEEVDEGCKEFPFALRATGPGGVTLYESPATSARAIAEIAHGESVNAVAIKYIRYYAHRGVVRRAGGGLGVGDTVYPRAWNELDAYPFHAWNDPVSDFRPDPGYTVERNGVSEFVSFDTPDAPLIDWQEVRPRERLERWYRLERAGGTQGWALVAPCALSPDNVYGCFEGERIIQADGGPESTASSTHVAFTLRADTSWGVVFSADGRSIITMGRDRVQRMWNAESGAPMGIAPTGFAPNFNYPSVRVVEDGTVRTFSPDGKYFATMGWGTVEILDARTGQVVRTVNHDEQNEGFHSVAFSPDGTRLLISDPWNTATLWDIATGAIVFRLHPLFPRSPDLHMSGEAGDPDWRYVRDANFSPDGRRIVTAVAGVVHVWDIPDAASGDR